MLLIIQQIALLAGGTFGAITDAKTGYIYDWITYPMIVIGIILSLWQMQWFNVASGAIIFILLYLLYKLGKVGGGDVKLFAGIAFLNPFNEINFLIVLFLVSAISAMFFYSIYYSLKFLRSGINLKKEKKNIFKGVALAIVLIVYLAIMYSSGFVSSLFVIFFGIPFVTTSIFIALQKGIKENFFEKKVTLKELEEDEIISENNSKKVLDLLKNKKLLGNSEIDLLKKNKINSLLVMRDLPKFAPFILVGLVFALIVPNLFFLLF